MNYKNIKVLALIFIILIIIIIIFCIKYNEYFALEPEPEPKPIDKTLLYGSLFLDNLDTQIQNLTNPPIMYEQKRIDIIKYNDILL